MACVNSVDDLGMVLLLLVLWWFDGLIELVVGICGLDVVDCCFAIGL